ncbi:MAG: YhdH/YhfP family quinone oxidoreductase, partial [Candidatus Omnitrophica bacterium]|nr:YhdH/YhfP family quinone oxidoreductase [Candidatus Omnitrophota bacterium]
MKFLPPHKAWVVRETDRGFSGSIEKRSDVPVEPGYVVVKTHYSALNYKDALSASGHKGITSVYPHIPGIDLTGEILFSPDQNFAPGQLIAVTGYDLGMNSDGGWSGVVQIPKAWVVPLPEKLSTLDAAAIGTAGLTAGLCLQRLLHEGLRPESGPVAVTGSTGGVGSAAVALLHSRGFQVTAVTGKKTHEAYLKTLGANEVLSREEFSEAPDRPLLKGRWAAAIDTAGGDLLSAVLRQIKPGGSVAVCGLVQSDRLHTSVYPFILRGVSLLGIDSA